MSDPIDRDLPWENRRLLLAALNPRPATRTVRTGTPTPETELDDSQEPDTQPGLLHRTCTAALRPLAWSWRKFNATVPADRRSYVVIIAVAVLAIFGAGIAGVNYMRTDVAPPTQAQTTPRPPDPTTRPPMDDLKILEVENAEDACPRDDNHADAINLFGTDNTKVWNCTRVKSEDHQIIKVTLARVSAIRQVRVLAGTAPTHRTVTKVEIFFPKNTGHPPVFKQIDNPEQWASITINPLPGPDGQPRYPATGTILIQVAETIEGPSPPTPTASAPADQQVTTVSLNKVQIIGTVS